MKKIYKSLLALLVFAGSMFSSFAQKSYFSDVSESAVKNQPGKREIIPQKFRTVTADINGLKNFLWSLPSEKTINHDRSNAPVMELPMPNGTVAKFHVWECSIMEPGLAAKFPEMRTFAGQGIDDRYATLKMDYNPYFGFSGQILSANTGDIYIDAYAKWNVNNYISYYRSDNVRRLGSTCDVKEEYNVAGKNPLESNFTAANCRGTQLYAYRLALACSGEYATAVCAPAAPTTAATAARMLTSVNRVDGVYERDLAVRMVLVANNDLLIYLDGTTDPYTNANPGNIVLSQNQTNVTAVIGTANYDIGHCFTTASGGVAGLGVVCNATNKARGTTGVSNPIGDGFDIDFVAHEMGHQFGCNHTFNSNEPSNCGPNRSGSHAYEPGSGTSIMAYAGVCANGENIQPNSDVAFHGDSFDAVSNFLGGTGGGCAVITNTGNTLPVIGTLSNNGVSIPPGTPFTLSGTATDADGDALTYSWEEWDLGPATLWNQGNNNPTSPLFRSREPKTTGDRTFPDPRWIAANYLPAVPPTTNGGLKGETLPTSARVMNFRFNVRDNRAGGGSQVSSGSGCQGATPFVVNVVGTTPFTVTVPNGGESYPGGSTQTVTWNVAGTNAAPVSATNVKISFSTDGGLTYPTVLLASTPNDGSEPVVMPSGATTTARVKVEAIGNIFFDISNANFTLTTPVTDFAFTPSTTTTVSCPAPATPSVTIATTATGGLSTPIVLSATAGVPAGTTVTFSPASVVPGSSTVATLNNANTLAAGTYTITVTGTAGAITHTTTITFTITAGAAPVITTAPTAQTVCAPAAATFTVVSSTAGVTYQWQSSPTQTGTYTNVTGGTGATTATYTTAATTAAMNGTYYRVVISTQCGSTTSTPVSLTVNTAAAITTQPSNAPACTGNTATFTVAATGTGVTYQWQSGTSSTGPWTNVATGTGGTTASYTTATITGSTPAFYHVIVTTSTCPATVTSNAVQLTISTTTAITTAPSAQTVCAPATATFAVTAAGTGNTYQWQSGPAATGPFTNVTGGTGATTASYTTAATTAAMSGTYYQVVITGACNTVTSTPVLLTVNTAAAITGQPAASTVCNGTTSTFTVTATGTGATYQWQSGPSATGPWTNVTGGTGATTASYTTAATTPAMNGTYYHVVVTTTTCAGTVTSNAVLLTVNTIATINTQPTAQSACVPNTATFTVAATGTGLTYQWQMATAAAPTVFTDITGATAATYTTPATTFAMNGNVYRVNILSTCSPTTPVTSNTAVLTVNNPVSVTQNPVALSGCAGANFTFSVTAVSTGSITYQWQVSTNGGTTYTNIAGATSATYTVTNPPINASGYLYRVIVSGAPCGLVTTPGVALTLSAKPQVVLTAAAPAGTVTNTNPSVVTGLYTTVSPVGNYTYQWKKDGVILPFLGTSITGANGILTEFGTYQVTVFDVATGCSSTSNSVTVSDVPEARNRLFISPNPAQGIVRISYYSSTAAAQARVLNVYDDRGSRIMTKAYTTSGIYGYMTLDLSALPKGVYMVELKDATGKKVVSDQIIKL